MTREHLAIVIVIIGLLAGAIQQFYALKSEVTDLRLRMEYLYGTGWTPQ